MRKIRQPYKDFSSFSDHPEGSRDHLAMPTNCPELPRIVRVT